MGKVTVIDVFNQYINSFATFINALFSDMEFSSGVSFGAITLVVAIFSIVIGMMYGRMKK